MLPSLYNSFTAVISLCKKRYHLRISLGEFLCVLFLIVLLALSETVNAQTIGNYTQRVKTTQAQWVLSQDGYQWVLNYTQFYNNYAGQISFSAGSAREISPLSSDPGVRTSNSSIVSVYTCPTDMDGNGTTDM